MDGIMANRLYLLLNSSELDHKASILIDADDADRDQDCDHDHDRKDHSFSFKIDMRCHLAQTEQMFPINEGKIRGFDLVMVY